MFHFGYTGRERDEATGLMYYRSRYYDPAVEWFLSEDPMGFDAGDADLYRYIFNSPTNYTDPTGEFAQVAVPVIAVDAIVDREVVLRDTLTLRFSEEMQEGKID